MKTEELLAKFGLNDLATTANESGLPAGQINDATTASVVSPTALKLDQWSVRRGEDVLLNSARLQSQNLDPLAVADFVGAAFELEPAAVDKCVDDTRLGYVKQLLDTPEYQQVHADSAGDLLLSEIAGAHFAQGFVSLKEELEAKRKRCEKTGEKQSPEDAAFEQEIATIRACGRAVEAAKEEIDQAKETAEAFGIGGNGPSPTKRNPAALAKLFKKIRNNETLRKIVANFGRFQRLTQALQRRKVRHGNEDVVGVTLGDEIAKLIPAELNNLAIPGLDLDLLRRLIEQQAIVRDHQGVEPVAKGAAVVVLDESGSMIGDKIEKAKAIALTFAWICRQQNRWCVLIAFSGGAKGRVLSLPPKKCDDVALFDWIEQFLSGGTTCDVPLVELPNVYWPALLKEGLPRGKTDISIITDAAVNATQNVIDDFNAWKKAEQAKVTTLVIGCGEVGDLGKVSDNVHLVRTLGLHEEAVSEILSI